MKCRLIISSAEVMKRSRKLETETEGTSMDYCWQVLPAGAGLIALAVQR